MKRLFVFGLILATLAWEIILPFVSYAEESRSRIGTPADPALISGRLNNGFQYFIMKNTTPRDRVSIHLKVFAGSVHEKDDEQGIAHYLEHMVFNGSENFKPGELIRYFQSIGMDFGADANARTGFYSTIYDLDLPVGDRTHLADAFVVIKDYAGGALLPESEVERERGVILAEKRERDSVSFRSFKKELAFELPGSILANRLPIGTEAVIKATDRELLKGFYDRWYRPDNMALVIVGDVDADMTESLVKETFASLTNRSDQPLAIPDISWSPEKGLRVFHHHEPEAGSTDITIQRIVHEPFEPETLRRLRDNVILTVGNMIFQNRLSRMVREQTADFTSASVYSGTYLKHLNITALQASCDPDQWVSALSQLDKALRQALDYGFLPRELARVKADAIAALESDVAGASTRKSQDIAGDLLHAMGRNELFLSPSQIRDLLVPHIRALSVDSVNAFFRASWANDQRMVMVTGNADIKAVADRTTGEEHIARVYTESTALSVPPYELADQKTFPYLKLPENRAGISAIRDDVNGLGIRQIDFENQVRLNLKTTDFKKGEISFRAVFGNGKGALPEAFYGLSHLVESAVDQSGFGRMDTDQLDAALAGREVGIGFSISDTCFVIRGTAAPKEAELVFQLLYTYFNDPGFRESGLALSKTRYRQQYDELIRTPEGIMAAEGSRFLAGGDPRFGLAPPDKIDHITMGAVETWLRPVCAGAPLEVSMVGDLDAEEMILLAKKYLGALGQRGAPEKVYPVSDGPVFPGGKKRVFTLDTRLDKAVVRVSYPTDDTWNVMQTRQMSMLSQVLSERLRLRVREKLGASYSPYMYNSPSRIYKGYGIMTAVVNLAPDAADMIAGEIKGLIDELVNDGVSDEELALVKKPLLNHLSVMRRNNNYWLVSVMGDSFRHPERLDWATHIVSGYENVTGANLTALARTYLKNENSALTVILPDIAEQ
ncbi:MAG: insulinase family protein [Desulfobacterales bacterium]|nr:insulinase family protein [Desulfobacterales bacterium]